jgi:hypothetical protein
MTFKEVKKKNMKLTMTNMNTGNVVREMEGSESDVRAFFHEKCEELGYAINGNEAGGIGHDYRLEIFNEKSVLAPGIRREVK